MKRMKTMKQKSENQKALPKFFKLLAVAGLIGGVLGSLSSVAGYFWQEHDLGAAFARMLNAGSPVEMYMIPGEKLLHLWTARGYRD